jgi:hypothetical protein
MLGIASDSMYDIVEECYKCAFSICQKLLKFLVHES